ncbi:MAG TPA: histidine kinase [Syntrophobacteraceae bacterium]|nr:histidine kinase [Syntrophobacteraceae bacterium]
MPKPSDEWLCREIVHSAQDAIIFSDPDGVIVLWNSGAETIFGFSAQEALGQTLDLIIPEKLRGRHWDGYFKVMKSGSTRYGQDLLAVPATRKDGERISIEFRIVLLRSPTGEVSGAAAVIRDVTARWRREKDLQERVAALEKRE